MDALKHHKRYLAMLTALSMLVTFIVPLILMEPADSMSGILICGKTEHIHDDSCYEDDKLTCGQELHTHSEACYLKYSAALKGAENEDGTIQKSHEDNKDVPNYFGETANKGYSPKTVPLYTLLFGELDDEAKRAGKTHWVHPDKSLDENLMIANQEYFLGFASDFCAFIESDFEAFDADAEGRMFVGGDLMFYGTSGKGEWNYQVGAGDYGHFTPIWDTDEYGHLQGFASGIIGGKVYRLATMTTGAKKWIAAAQPTPVDRHIDGNDVFLYPEEGAYKKFILGNLDASIHYNEDYLEDEGEKDISYSNNCNHKIEYSNCEICKNKANNDDPHGYLRNVNEIAQFYNYDDVRTLLEKTFDTLKARSLSLSTIDAINVSVDNSGKLVLDATNIGDAKTVYFKVDDWKGVNRVEINVPQDRVRARSDKYTPGHDTVSELDLNIIVTCDDTEISLGGIATFVIPSEETFNEDKHKISNRNADNTNNHPLSSNILYNFYNATSVDFPNTDQSNINGTILAPHANVTTKEECPGHLSGALIAKSFYGGLEFGYRPYRGGADIFGMVSGYAVPVDKVDQDGEALSGALFAIKENAKFVSLFESGNNPNFAALPSRVDYTANAPYERDLVVPGTGGREHAGQEENGEKLTAPVKFELYKTYKEINGKLELQDGISITENENTNGANIGNTVKFYLKPDQKVTISENENYKCTGPDDNGVYTIQLIKPTKSFNITAINAFDSTSTKTVTITREQNMTLNVTANDNGNPIFEVGYKIKLTPNNPLTGADKFYYKYFVNGNPLQEENVYNEGALGDYMLSSAGNMLYSVKAFINIDGVYYEVAQAESKITIKDKDIGAATVEISPNSVIAGDNFTINVKGLPRNATVEYYFIDDTNPIATQTVLNDSTSYTVSTVIKDEKGQVVEYIAGKALPIIVKIQDENGNKATRNDTITVNFKEDMALTGYNTNYTVNANTEPYKFKLSNSNYKDAEITYYFNNQPIEGNAITPTLVNISIPVYAKITANGLEKTIYGANVYGTYDNNIWGTLTVANGPFLPKGKIEVSLSGLTLEGALKDATIVFRAYDSYGNPNWKADGTKGTDGTWKADFSFDQSGDYTIRAFMLLSGNTEKEVGNGSVKVEQMELTGELTVDPDQIYNGNNVTFKVTNVTEGAKVSFTIKDPYGKEVDTLHAKDAITTGSHEETYTPSQAGNYTVYATFTKDGYNPRERQYSFTVKENTSAYTSDYTITGLDENKKVIGNNVNIIVESDAEGASLEIKVQGPREYLQGGNIGGGKYEYPITLEAGKEGQYTVYVTININGESEQLKTDTFTFGEVESYTGNITFEENDQTGDYIAQENINVNLSTNAPVGTNVLFKYYYCGNYLGADGLNWCDDTTGTVNENGICRTSFYPDLKGVYTVKALINGAVVAEADVTAHAQFTFEVGSGQEARVTLSRIDDNETVGEIEAFTINGKDVTIINVENKVIRFSQPTESGTLYLRVKLSGGAVTYCSRTITVNGSNVSIGSVIQSTYSLRRYLSILEDEIEVVDETTTETPDNKISFEAPEGETISKVKLVFPSAIAEGTEFKLKATFTIKDQQNPTEDYFDQSKLGDHPTYIEISCPANTTEVKFEAVAGSVTIDKCYPTHSKTENKLSKTSYKSFTLKANVEKEIPVQEWVSNHTLDSLTFNLDNAGEIYYALIAEGDTGIPVFTKIPAEANQKTISISGLNAENIKKIKIFTTSNSLTVKNYQISAFIGDETYENLDQFKDDNLDIINNYTLVEQQGPVGYFKENTVYNIEVKETVNLATLDNHVPKNVITTITVKDVTGNIVMKYTVDVFNKDSNSKTIKIGEDTFTVTKSGETITVTKTNKDNTTETLDWDTTKAGKHGDYYFDPVSMIVVPVPTPIRYANEKGLLFRKIDDGGASVRDVKIIVQQKNDSGEWTDVSGNVGWNWAQGVTSESVIAFNKLTKNTVYRFHETDTGGKYEPAKDIYFEMVEETVDESVVRKVYYWQNSETRPEAGKYKVLDIVNDNVIRMTNIRIPGLVPTLVKTDLDGKIINDGTTDAKFCLYAKDGTEVLHNITVTNGKVELNFDEYKNKDTTYVGYGYLKPGTYYLKEIAAPEHFEASMKLFYFNVTKDKNGGYYVSPVEIAPGISKYSENKNGETWNVLEFNSDAFVGVTENMITDNDVILQLNFTTSADNEVKEGWGNIKFSGSYNEEDFETAKAQVRKKYIQLKLTAADILELAGVTLPKNADGSIKYAEVVNLFEQLESFKIGTVNSTKVDEYQLIKIKDKAENIATITINSRDDNLKINDFTITYNDSTKKELENVDFKKDSNKNYTNNFDVSEDLLKNVANISFKLSGYDGEKEITITTADGRKIWGSVNAEDSNGDIFGNTNHFSRKTNKIKKDVTNTFGFTPTPEDDSNAETTETPKVPTLTTNSNDRNTLYVSNKAPDTRMKLRAEKRWNGDKGITELRKTVEVQLMRSTTKGENYTEVENYTDSEGKTISGKQELTKDNNWTYIWKDLPRYVDETDETKGLYYYTVKEITSVTGYTSSVEGTDINESGTVVIINTAETVEIPVNKSWEWNTTKYGNLVLPKTVKFKLQVNRSLDSEKPDWIDVPGKTLTITERDNTWSGKFTGLIKGYEYRIKEVDVPYGWNPGDIAKVTTTGNTIGSFEVTNTYSIPEGQIQLQKLWQEDKGTRPYSVMLNLYRSVIAPSYTESDAPYTDGKLTGNANDPDYKDDYARLLQQSLFFYDANMCGDEVSEHSALSWRTNCHTEDEVPGGYHDAGDHVMFGLPQGYTASMLGWSYYEFFKGNVLTNDTKPETQTGNTHKMFKSEDEHLKTILKHFYDFFVNSVKYDEDGKIKEILVQKGFGYTDHVIWCAPEIQTNRAKEMIWKSSEGSNVAAQYAGALALGYLNFKDDPNFESSNYLKVAEDLYEFANRTSPFKAGDSLGDYYQDKEDDDDKAWAANWLYRATDKSMYKNNRAMAPGQLQWDDVSMATAIAYATQTNDWAVVIDKINSEYINPNSNIEGTNVSRKEFYSIHSWGTARFNAIAQTATLITAKHLYENGTKTHTDSKTYATIANGYVSWAKGEMDKILGANTWKDTISTNGCVGGTLDTSANLPICLVTNFVPDGFDVDTPQAPHHRAASGLDDNKNGNSNNEYVKSCGYDDDSYQLIGALVGGPAFKSHVEQQQMIDYNHTHPLTEHTYIDDLHDYCCNEVAIDYNSGLVGAAAGLYYFEGTGERSTKIEGVEYGKYGLSNPTYDKTYGLETPIKGAIDKAEKQESEADNGTTTLVDGGNIISYAMKQTSVRVMADESKYTLLGTYSVASSEYNHNKDCEYTLSSITEGKTVDLIEMVFDGNGSITGQIVPNGSWNDRMEPNNVALVDNVLSISTFPKSISKIKINNWGTNVNLIAIRLYTERTGPSINSDHSTIAQGDTLTLTYSESGVTPNWSVANKDTSIINELASMTGNVLTANGVGVVVVKASDASDNELAKKEITIEEFAISGNSDMTVNSGQQTLKTNSISDNIAWESSNTNVVTVNNGVVTVIGKGTAIITATNNGYSDTFTINVTKQMPQLTFNGNATIYVGGETYVNRNMDLTVNHRDAYGNVGGLTIENNNKVIANTPGYYTLWIEDDDHDKSELSLTVKPKISIDGNNSTNGTNTTIDVGNHITFTLNPDAEIQYSSNSTDNADGLTKDSNNNKKFTAAKAGTYKIWTHVNGVNSDEIQITVNPVATSLKITPDDYYLQTDVGKNITISGSTGNIAWTFGSVNSNGATVTADSTAIEVVNQQLVAHKPGTYIVTGTDEAGGTVSFKVEVGDYIAKVVINNYATNGWGDKISVPALPDEYSTYEIDRVGFKLSGKAADGKYKFGIDNLSSETQDYEFNNLSENFCHTINIKPTENVQYGTWSQKGIVPTAMYLIYNRPTLAIAYGNEKPDEITITEGETITLKQANKKDNTTVTWKLNNTKDKEGDTYDFTAPNVDATTEYTITASDGTNEDTIKIKVNPLTITKINDTNTITDLTPITLQLNTTRDLSEFTWTSSNPDKIAVKNGVLTVKANTGENEVVTITAEYGEITASIDVKSNVAGTAIGISGHDSTGIGGEIKLQRTGGYLGATYEWSSLTPDIATVDPNNGKVTGKAKGTATIQLTATKTDGTTDTATKEITISEWFATTIWDQGTESNYGSKYYYQLSDLPAGAILKKVSINISPEDGQATTYGGALMLGKENEPNKLWNQKDVSGDVPVGGVTLTIDSTEENGKYMNGIDCSNPDHYFCFGLWGSGKTVKINWITFEYEMDSKYVEILYSDDSRNKTIRIGEQVTVKLNAVGGEIGTVQLVKDGTVVETYSLDGATAIASDSNQKYQMIIKPTKIGNCELVVTMKDDETERSSINLTIKDVFSVSQDNVQVGDTLMVDLNSTSLFTVNNLMGEGPNWTITVEEGYSQSTTNNVVTINKNETKIAEFDISTGMLTTFSEGGGFTLTASDDYGEDTTVNIDITIVDRPKLPVLPKDIFLEPVPGQETVEIKIGSELVSFTKVGNLPMYDSKGNPYYYYIQETGYKTSSSSQSYRPLKETGHFINTSKSSFMPYIYYNNGIRPIEQSENGTATPTLANTATVGNKFVSEIQGTLPSTGGSGVTTYYYLGGVIMLLSIAGFTGLKRRERKRRKE